MTNEELLNILEKHKHWINEDVEGWEDMRADLREARLCGAELWRADLRGANLCGAKLREADLCGADLRGADLREASLWEADLRGADLREADLCGAELWRANLRGASLCGADLWKADLRGASLCGASNVPFIPQSCPDTGSFIGYKKACNNIIVKLEICEDARRSSATGRKCRCDKARVLSLTKLDGTDANVSEIASCYNSNFIYRVGEIVEEPSFSEDRFEECASGIHFFINRQEAVDYY